MRVCQSLICCLFLTALQDRDSLVDAQTNVYRKREGEDITVTCRLRFSGSRRLFCKDSCKAGNILIDTDRDDYQRGRYSIKYEYVFIGSSILNVTITKLTKSDSGLYRCESDGLFLNSEEDFKIIVTKASVLSEPTTHITSVLWMNTKATDSTTKSLDSTSSSHQTTNQQTRSDELSVSVGNGNPAGPVLTAPFSILLYVGLALVGLLFMFSVALLIFTRSRRSKQTKDPPSETQYANITLKNQEIRENTSSAVRISTVYANVKYKNGERLDRTDVYSIADCPQEKVEDHSVKYSVIQFPVSASPSSAPCGHKDNDIYSSA